MIFVRPSVGNDKTICAILRQNAALRPRNSCLHPHIHAHGHCMVCVGYPFKLFGLIPHPTRPHGFSSPGFLGVPPPPLNLTIWPCIAVFGCERVTTLGSDR
jgi:hypothetical protein